MSSFDNQVHSDEHLYATEEYAEFLRESGVVHDRHVVDESDWDDGQPDMYTECQDLYGGDDWDHGQYDLG